LRRIGKLPARPLSINVLVQCQTNLPQVRFALRAPCRFSRILHCRQQQRNEHSDNRDHDQQLN
jgi:hypothetical protein